MSLAEFFATLSYTLSPIPITLEFEEAALNHLLVNSRCSFSLSLRLKRLLLPCATIAFLMNIVIYNAWRLLLSGLLGAETGDTSKAPLSFMCHTLLEWLSSTHRRSRWGLCIIRLFACTQIKCVKLQHISRKIIDEANEEYQSILCANIDDFMYL